MNSSSNFEEILDALYTEASLLDGAPPRAWRRAAAHLTPPRRADVPLDEPATTLFVLTDAMFADFDDFMGAFEAATEITAQASKNLQLIPFHPLATYSEVPGDDAADFASRSPHPLFHLLRESDVRAAEAAWGRRGGRNIQESNEAMLRGLGHAAMADLLARCKANTAA